MLTLALSESEQQKMIHRIYIRANALLAGRHETLAAKSYQKLLALRAAGITVDSKILADVLHNLGMIAENNQETESAIIYYSRALQEDETHSMTWLFLAKLYMERYQREKRKTDYEQALNALVKAEVTTKDFPAVQFLKQKFAIA